MIVLIIVLIVRNVRRAKQLGVDPTTMRTDMAARYLRHGVGPAGSSLTDRLAERGSADAFGTVDDRMQLVQALGSIGDDYRVAVVLRDVADLDYAEIADVLGIPPGTVRSRIARGRAALAVALGTNHPDPDVKDDEP